MSQMTISQIDAWLCTLPLAQPINLGPFTMRQRIYLAVRVRTQEGLAADCVTQARGAPLDLIMTEVLGPRLVGKNALDVYARHAELKLELIAMGMDGSIGRAWSVLEICLQDLRAQAAGWPMWRLLGGVPRAVDVELVEGYTLVDETDQQFAERLAARVEEGYQYLKVEAGHYGDHDELVRRLAAFRELSGARSHLVLDFAWSWPNAKDKLALVHRLEEFGIAWIEDPFPREQIDDFVFLRNHAAAPIGAGDETTRPADIRALIAAGGLDLVRIDATAIGGYEAARELSTLARANHLRVSFHDRPEIHEHCVFGFGATDHVEIFPTDRPFDRAHDLLQSNSFSRVQGGRLTPSDAPGTGLKLDDAAVSHYATRHTHIRA